MVSETFKMTGSTNLDSLYLAYSKCCHSHDEMDAIVDFLAQSIHSHRLAFGQLIFTSLLKYQHHFKPTYFQTYERNPRSTFV
jgi:hypothetical protein